MRRVFFLLIVLALVPSIIFSAVGCGKETTTSKVLRVNLAGEPSTIDPNRASWSDERSVIDQCFQGLLGFNEDLTLKPVVAEEIPTIDNGGISSDGKTCTFKLRHDVTWSDGIKVNAQDFEYSIKRMLDPALAADYASFYYNIVGAEDYNSGSASRDAVEVMAIDPYTLQINLSQSQPTFLQLMALWPVYPIRQDIVTQYGDQWTDPPHYIGNGPFLLTEWVHQDHMTFKVNENYWGTKPKLSEMQYKMITDVNAELAAYKNNELDMSRVPAGSEKAIMADPVLSQEILRFNQLVTFAFEFNVNETPFDNKLVRQAFATAIDRVSFVDNVMNGVGEPALSWIPPGIPGYDPNLGKEYEFNISKAKELLAEAGYSDVSKLPPISFQYADTGNNRLIAQFLQGQIQDNLGITITLEPMEAKAFEQLVGANQETWAYYGWGADYPDPEDWLPIFETASGNNNTLYSNPEFDALCQEAEHELNNTLRMQEWAEAANMLSDDCPIIPLLYREGFWLAKPNVKDIIPTGVDGEIPGDTFFTLTYISE